MLVDLEQKIEISLDDQVILNEALLIKNSYYNCSNSKIFLFIGSVPHSAKNPKFSLKISNIFKWGIRNLELSVNKCEDNCIECTSNKICTNPCSYSNYKSNELICPKYYQCYETCDNCMGPSMNDCLVCKDSENYLLQNTTCVDLSNNIININIQYII